MHVKSCPMPPYATLCSHERVFSYQLPSWASTGKQVHLSKQELPSLDGLSVLSMVTLGPPTVSSAPKPNPQMLMRLPICAPELSAVISSLVEWRVAKHAARSRAFGTVVPIRQFDTRYLTHPGQIRSPTPQHSEEPPSDERAPAGACPIKGSWPRRMPAVRTSDSSSRQITASLRVLPRR